MNLAAGENADMGSRRAATGCITPIVHDDIAYCAWRDAGLVVLDVKDRAKPKLIVHKNWSPPFGGGTHNCLPLPDRDLLVVLDEAVLDHQEDGLKLIWVFDNRVPSNPVSISTFPTPAEADYKAKGGHFGPHNIHENRPGSFVELEADLRHLSERRRARLRHGAIHSRRRRSAPGAAAAGEARRHAAEPRARHPVGRRVRRRGGADLRHRLQCRALYSGVRSETPSAHLLHQRVGHFEIGVDVLHVVAVVERLDQLQQLLAGFVVDRDGVLRLPQQRRLARLAEFRLQRLGDFVQASPAW